MEIQELVKEMTRRLLTTKEYNQYHTLLERVKSNPELYGRIGDFRRRSIYLNLAEGENRIQANNALQNEFRDLLNNGLASDFLVAERQYCRLVSEIQDALYEGAGIDTSFLDQ